MDLSTINQVNVNDALRSWNDVRTFICFDEFDRRYEVTAATATPLFEDDSIEDLSLRNLINLGLLHSEDGPALIPLDADKAEQSWYRHGQLHRTDGPACHYEDGMGLWWVAGEYLFEGPDQLDRLTPEDRDTFLAAVAADNQWPREEDGS